MKEILWPFLLSLIAGSTTGIGGLIVLAFGRISDRLMGFLMGFAGGVMLIVSFLNLSVEALAILSLLEVVLGFTVGALFIMIIDLILPHVELGRWEEGVVDSRLFKTGLITTLGMSLHNFPEGLVVSTGYARIPKLGLLIAIIICLHNIPEGIATVIPLTLAGVGKLKAVALAFLSGLTEPIGALIGATILSALGGSEHFIGMGLAFAAGVMTYITVDELIPTAHEYGTRKHKHMVSTGLLSGMIFAQLIAVAFEVLS